MTITRGITSPITRPLTSAVTEGGNHGRIPQPGDYLVMGNDFLTDESGNRLTA